MLCNRNLVEREKETRRESELRLIRGSSIETMEVTPDDCALLPAESQEEVGGDAEEGGD